jgi:hypothetical protein
MNYAVKKTLITILIATMLISPLIVSQSHAAETNPPIYNLTGTWQLTIHSTEDTRYFSMNIALFDQNSGAFSGQGFDKTVPSTTFAINGIETGTSVSFTLTYTVGSPYGYYATGSLTSNSFMSGTAVPFFGDVQYGSRPWDAIKFSNPNVILDFPPGSNVQVAVTESPSNGPYPPLQGIIGNYFTITVTGTFSGQVKIGIHYLSGTNPTYIAKIDLLLGDVNHDGKVNLLDIAIILKAMFTDRGDKRFNPACDLNNDGKVNLQDLAIAFQNFGKTPQWADLTNTYIDPTTNFAYATTDIFSGFGVH